MPASVKGGAEIRLLRMLPRFKRITPVVLGHRALDGLEATGVETCYWDEYPGCVDPYPYDPRNVMRHARAVASAARTLRPDVTFGWMHNGCFFVAAAATFHGLKGKLAGNILGPPTEHFRLASRRATLYERLLFAWATRRLDLLITPSEGVRRDLVENFRAPARRTRSIFNGIDLEQVCRLAADSLPVGAPDRGRPWIVSASRLSREKGFDVLLDAAATLAEHHIFDLVILGDGPERAMIEQRAAALGIEDRVFLPGFVENPYPWIARAMVYASASRLEGFGNSIVEALALGTPVVSTQCRWGPIEILAEPDSGLLVPVDDPPSLAAAMASVLEDPVLHEVLSAGGRQRAEAFRFERMLTSYEDAILRIAANGGT